MVIYIIVSNDHHERLLSSRYAYTHSDAVQWAYNELLLLDQDFRIYELELVGED